MIDNDRKDPGQMDNYFIQASFYESSAYPSLTEFRAVSMRYHVETWKISRHSRQVAAVFFS